MALTPKKELQARIGDLEGTWRIKERFGSTQDTPIAKVVLEQLHDVQAIIEEVLP
jgi:hypothetical protein